MKEARGDLWELGRNADAVVVTTNGTVKMNGEAVMGAGCAKEALERHPWLGQRLAKALEEGGNHVHLFYISPEQGVTMPLITFPTKKNWWESADLDLITRSVMELDKLAWDHKWEKIVMPRPGIGNGGLRWEDVLPIVQLLDDRFTIVTW